MTTAVLGALADPTRRRVFAILNAQGPVAVVEIARQVPVSRPAVSQHLKVLTDVGLATAHQVGRRRLYRAVPAGLKPLRQWLERQWDAALDEFEQAAREDAIMETGISLPPIVKTRTVPIPPERAFALFTERMGDWWPTTSHSISASADAGIRFEGRVGGRVVELTPDGEEHAWADVLAWDPPHRFALSWHPTE
ncbi:MAG: metalloregulator ArsR/SmtB family transcription factor [Nitriliruptorales bacterium]|nr:metalloregulator ArsR/SmtB family transcription factor [Nitriliruptorales bacterium]